LIGIHLLEKPVERRNVRFAFFSFGRKQTNMDGKDETGEEQKKSRDFEPDALESERELLNLIAEIIVEIIIKETEK